MDRHRVFIIGNSMFAEGIAQLLHDHQVAEIVGNAPAIIDLALSPIDVADLDAIIVVASDGILPDLYAELLARYPGLSLITADLNADKVRVTTSQCIQARSTDLLAAISALPKRR